MTTLDEAIRRQAARGDQVAVAVHGRDESTALTWQELAEASELRAARFTEPGCLVVSLTGQDIDELVTLVAALRTDRPVCVLGARQPPSVRDALLDRLHAAGSALPPGALLLASSGSTGRPKLVVDRGIRATAAKPAVMRPFLHTGWRDGHRQVVASPLHHAAGLTPFVEGLVGGASTYLQPVFDAAALTELVETHRIDWLQLTPFHMSALLTGDHGPDRWPGEPTVVHMAEHCPARVKRAFHDALGPEHVYELYTASEGIGMTMARGDEWDRRPGTVGRGFLTTLRIGDEDGVPLGPHRTGLVYLRSGARSTQTYLSAAGRLRMTPDGFATLGDTGHLDDEGYLYLRPRQLTTISVAGVTVSAAEVEAELREHPGVADAGVCAVSSASLGERVAAVVVAADGLTEPALRRWARGRLDAAHRPARFVFAPAVPRGQTGKLDRVLLQALVEHAEEGRTTCGTT